VVCVCFLGVVSAWSQESASVEASAPAAVATAQESVTAPIAGLADEPETQWLWGDVSSVDVQNNQFTAKYRDYEGTDELKEIVISVDERTAYENVKALLDIKPNDAVSIDYKAMPDGRNIAKLISVEKAAEQAATPPAVKETFVSEPASAAPRVIIPQAATEGAGAQAEQVSVSDQTSAPLAQ